jgi:hypothetical protein
MNRGVQVGVLLVFGAEVLLSQAPSGEKQPLSETVFKNIQVLKGIPVTEFMNTMGFFSAALGLNCVYCHSAESLSEWDKFAEDIPRKRVARSMLQMVNALNKSNFGGRPVITCNTCHNGNPRPKGMPSLATQYSTPDEDPNEVEIPAQPVKGPSAEELLDKFISASGGASRLSAIASLIAKGKYEGYETYHQAVPFEWFAKSPMQMTTLVHTQNGTSTTVFDGRAGWLASPQNPVMLLPLSQGAELDGARLDAALLFPAGIKQALNQWRSGFPPTSIGKADVQIVQGMGPGGTKVKLYLDQDSGLLLRQLRYSVTAVGTNPIQVDYEDYRDSGGLKLPYRLIVTWTNGRSTFQIEELQPNANIASTVFAKPAPAVVTPLKPVTR